MMTIGSKSVINVQEHSDPTRLETRFSDDEIQILRDEFRSKVEVSIGFDKNQYLKTLQYVGSIVLPHHIIRITPKISNISFINMVRYSLELPDVKQEDLGVDEKDDFYDILIRFLLQSLQSISRRGLHNSHVYSEDNFPCIRGKILFKENLLANFGRYDKVFCGFSETTPNVMENQIIKYTLFYLLHGRPVNEEIASQLMEYYRRFDQIDLKPISLDVFKSLGYTLLNIHYKPILDICEIMLRDSSVNFDLIGEKSALSFLVDMNFLFERFVGNLLKESLGENRIKLQETVYTEEVRKTLKIKADIVVFDDSHQPSIILDTKYKEMGSFPEESEIAQMVYYCHAIGVTRCGLLYAGSHQIKQFDIKGGIQVSAISFDLSSIDKKEFEQKCSVLVASIRRLMHESKDGYLHHRRL